MAPERYALDLFTARLLGYAGLLPFIGVPLLALLDAWETTLSLSMLYALYSCLILGFMAGVLWPVLCSVVSPLKQGLVAVGLVVVSVITFALLSQFALLVQAGLFALLRLYEIKQDLDAAYPPGYPGLRTQLTTVVVCSHLCMWWLS
ncbi:DUF3429 domain-containing protein [Lacimicrobium sp. SS2-24]|uniref:DUF3429 domain-containing protein n=1 Tax=Lacimicrobium sp. SS2-24 TaxID=2005569 RepID=UPI000B4BFDE6|nr:DUF3429 domain-containing protein [Lacimicrobium sp. SS2-24]